MKTRFKPMAVVLLAVLPYSLFAQDTYHNSLKAYVKSITSGATEIPDAKIDAASWVFVNNQATSAQNMTTVPTTSTLLTGQSVGSNTLSVRRNKTTTIQTNPWLSNIELTSTSSVAINDQLLLIFWARATEATLSATTPSGIGLVAFNIQGNADLGYTKFVRFQQRLGTAWKQYLIPVKVTKDAPSGKLRFVVEMGNNLQTIEVAGMNALNFGQESNVAFEKLRAIRQTSETDNVNLDARKPEGSTARDFRDYANDRIKLYRQADLNITVKNKNGLVIKNAKVQVEMLAHEFNWGTAIQENRLVPSSRLYNASTDPTYSAKLTDLDGQGKGHGFNMAVLENGHKWSNWSTDWVLRHKAGNTEHIQMIADLKTRGVNMRGHTLVWPGWSNMIPVLDTIYHQTTPPLPLSSKLTIIRDSVLERTQDMLTVTGINGAIKEWDIINEPTGNVDLANALKGNTVSSSTFGSATYDNTATGRQGREIYQEIFNRAKSTDGTVKRYLNDNPYVNIDGKDSFYEKILGELGASDNTLVEGVGIQAHFTHLIPATELFTKFDRVTNLIGNGNGNAKKFKITEYDNGTLANDAAHKRFFEDLLRISFSHPRCDGFLMWGFWEGTSSKAPLLTSSWAIKETAKPFFDLVFKEWWTIEDTLTNTSGVATLRGFKGKYKVSITVGNSTPVTYVVDNNLLLTGSTVNKTYTINTSLTDGNARIGAENELNSVSEEFPKTILYPNPSDQQLTIERSADTECTIQVLNLNGQVIKSVSTNKRRITLDTGNLASGTYIIEISDKISVNRQKLVIK